MKLIRTGLVAVATAFLGLATLAPAAAQNYERGTMNVQYRGLVDPHGNPIFRDGRPSGNWHNGHRANRHWRNRDHRPRYRPRYHQPRSNFYLEFNAPSTRYVEPRRVIRGSRAHVSWCMDRYRSYRVRDNSWQPYNGPRRQCRSPYM